MKKAIIVLLVISCINAAQNIGLEKDTSYTIYSAFKKLEKDYPFVKPVLPLIPNKVNAYREIAYAKYDDRELKLDLFFGNIDNKLQPAVLLVHGGGWRSGDKSLTFPIAVKLAEHGFAAVSVEYRLSNEAKFPAAIIDVNNAVKWTKKNASEYGIDSSQIVILGCSAGAQIATLIGFANNVEEFEDSAHFTGISNDVKAIINIDGVIDFLGKGSEEFDEVPDPQNPRSAHLWLGASQIERPDLWEKASSVNYINKNSPPILFINSSQARFHAGRDEAIQVLEKFNIYYEVKTIENTPHTFWLFHPWFETTLDIITDFLDRVIDQSQN